MRAGYRGQCDRCEHRAEEFPLCDHPGLYDLDMAETGQRPPEATRETLATGRLIRGWRGSPMGRCPGFTRKETP